MVKTAFHRALISGPGPAPVAHVPAGAIRQGGAPRGPRPELGEFDEIGDIPYHVLAELVAWIESDGLNRTEDEVVTETIEELGFQRRGSRIVEAVIRARRLNRPDSPSTY